MATEYTTAMQYATAPPSWISPEDRERIAAYQFYEDIYNNVPNTFKIAQRGTDSDPVYIPSGKAIVEATNRFLAKNFRFMVNPEFGTEEQQKTVELFLESLFKREEFYSKFTTQRRYGLIRGDAVWHITADPNKPEGKRLTIQDVDPASYFPIYADDDLDKLVGCHIAEQWELGDDTYIRRQTYRKENGRITSQCDLFEIGAWDDRIDGGKIKKVKSIIPKHELPPEITVIPVYHIKNGRVPGGPFGTSEMKGLERLFAAVNQAISDEELSLALDGIGLYATTSGPPTDDNGNEINWRLGPGRVVELENETDFKRVTGVSNVNPIQQHISFIMESEQQAVSVPDVAMGKVDVTVAESGVALALQLSPILAKNSEKETEMMDVYDHMLYDLIHMWLPIYEGMPQFDDVVARFVVDDPMPTNTKAEITNIVTLVGASLMSMRTAHKKLVALGIDIPEDEVNEIISEMQAKTDATSADMFGTRMQDELDNMSNV